MSETLLAKIAISMDADAALTQALDQINKGNTGGRISKTDLASWFVIKSGAALNDQGIEEIRLAHFNQVKYLEGLVRGLKQAGRDSLSIDEISKLQTMMRQMNTAKKSKSRKGASIKVGDTMVSEGASEK